MTACGTTAAAGGLREQILSAAQACFHKRGFKATTMNAVARQAGMSVGNLYNYFGGKDAIIDEIAQREVARLAAEVDAVVNGRMPIGEQRELFGRCARSFRSSVPASRSSFSTRRPKTSASARSSPAATSSCAS